ncbi:hypothetical protein [Tengunoibacter tsumagoiensis]|uniref:Uncharacterized protein n=1 Tax=Tengunoibacter tsumagoiensis TaxID=2014871 RepID=A0A402AA41_9CHLR|nr:hypothetical protein [Tengunoibacter tsumagoiensis]GCE15825.1 hypothetical protein KTT_56840 [Tengunoibacter tsumagoiensis]
MDDQQSILYQKLIQSIQTRPGSTPPSLRKALTDHVIQTDLTENSHFPPEGEISPDLQTYVTKVRKHAYKVTDEDVEQLKQAGYSEEAIFEITLSTALGAGTKSFLQGMAAIEGASNETTHS